MQDWKTLLVQKLNELNPTDFDVGGHADVIVPFSVPWAYSVVFMKSTMCINRYPVAWVGPGYLLLAGANAERTADGRAVGTVCFTVARDRPWNHTLPVYPDEDFLAL